MKNGSRINRSTTGATFALRQIHKKVTEFYRLAIICFVELCKAFDKIILDDELEVKKKILIEIINTIKSINTLTPGLD